jgi:hypothetical protein
LKVTALWKYRFKITDFDFKFRPKKEEFQNVLKYIPDFWLGDYGTFSSNVPYNSYPHPTWIRKVEDFRQ